MKEIEKLIQNNYLWFLLSSFSITLAFLGEKVLDIPIPKTSVYIGLFFLTLTILPPFLKSVSKSIQILKNYDKLFLKGVKLKRDLGITSGILFLSHAFFAWKNFADLNLNFLFEIEIITGALALIIFIILLLTSNQYSIKKLRANWKKVQSLVWLSIPLFLIHALLASSFFQGEIPKLTILFAFLIIIPPVFYFIKEKDKDRSILIIYGIIIAIVVLGILNLIKTNTPITPIENIENTTPTTEQVQEEQNRNLITREEVSKHNEPGDCWLIYKGKVYDFTNYLENHPPGASLIIPFCGESVDQVEETHVPSYSSPQIKQIFEENYIGELE